MKKLLSIVFLFAFSIAAFGQTAPTKTVKELQLQAKPFKNSKRYFVVYDKFEDRTLVRCLGFNLIGFGASFAEAMAQGTGAVRGSASSSIYLGAAFTFPSDTLRQSVTDYFLLFDYSGSEWQFLKTSKLIALVDGERIQFGSGEAVRDVKSGSVTEKIGFVVTRQQLQKLSAAKTIEIKIGSFEKPLKAEYMEMFSNVLKLGDTAQKVEDKKKK
jgi:hypothetical protein